MAKRVGNIALWVVMLLATACGEDRSGEYYAIIQTQTWMEEQMRDCYLWYEDVPEIETTSYTTAIGTFFGYLLSTVCNDEEGDNFSYIDTDSCQDTPLEASAQIDNTSSYGFEFQVMKDPTGTTARAVARILFVVEGSPADRAGLKRGDWVITIDGSYFTTSKYTALKTGSAVTFQVNTLTVGTNSNGKTTKTWGTVRDVAIEAAEAVSFSPFIATATLKNVENTGINVGYVMYDRFASGESYESTTYNDEMKSLFTAFKQAGVTELVLDLRYNPGGVLSCVDELCSYIAPTAALGKTLYTLKYNDMHTDSNVSVKIPTEHEAQNLGLTRLFVLTSTTTASASELVIYCLSPYMEVNVIGCTTAGKNVVLQGIASPYEDCTIHPVVAQVFDCNGNSEFYGGILPNYSYVEASSYGQLEPLGSEDEAMLQLALRWIVDGSL